MKKILTLAALSGGLVSSTLSSAVWAADPTTGERGRPIPGYEQAISSLRGVCQAGIKLAQDDVNKTKLEMDRQTKEVIASFSPEEWKILSDSWNQLEQKKKLYAALEINKAKDLAKIDSEIKVLLDSTPRSGATIAEVLKEHELLQKKRTEKSQEWDRDLQKTHTEVMQAFEWAKSAKNQVLFTSGGSRVKPKFEKLQNTLESRGFELDFGRTSDGMVRLYSPKFQNQDYRFRAYYRLGSKEIDLDITDGWNSLRTREVLEWNTLPSACKAVIQSPPPVVGQSEKRVLGENVQASNLTKPANPVAPAVPGVPGADGKSAGSAR